MATEWCEVLARIDTGDIGPRTSPAIRTRKRSSQGLLWNEQVIDSFDICCFEDGYKFPRTRERLDLSPPRKENGCFSSASLMAFTTTPNIFALVSIQGYSHDSKRVGPSPSRSNVDDCILLILVFRPFLFNLDDDDDDDDDSKGDDDGKN